MALAGRELSYDPVGPSIDLDSGAVADATLPRRRCQPPGSAGRDRHRASTDTIAVLPARDAFPAADEGVHAFTGGPTSRPRAPARRPPPIL